MPKTWLSGVAVLIILLGVWLAGFDGFDDDPAVLDESTIDLESSRSAEPITIMEKEDPEPQSKAIVERFGALVVPDSMDLQIHIEKIPMYIWETDICYWNAEFESSSAKAEGTIQVTNSPWLNKVLWLAETGDIGDYSHRDGSSIHFQRRNFRFTVISDTPEGAESIARDLDKLCLEQSEPLVEHNSNLPSVQILGPSEILYGEPADFEIQPRVTAEFIWLSSKGIKKTNAEHSSYSTQVKGVERGSAWVGVFVDYGNFRFTTTRVYLEVKGKQSHIDEQPEIQKTISIMPEGLPGNGVSTAKQLEYIVEPLKFQKTISMIPKGLPENLVAAAEQLGYEGWKRTGKLGGLDVSNASFDALEGYELKTELARTFMDPPRIYRTTIYVSSGLSPITITTEIHASVEAAAQTLLRRVAPKQFRASVGMEVGNQCIFGGHAFYRNNVVVRIAADRPIVYDLARELDKKIQVNAIYDSFPDLVSDLSPIKVKPGEWVFVDFRRETALESSLILPDGFGIRSELGKLQIIAMQSAKVGEHITYAFAWRSGGVFGVKPLTIIVE